MGNGKVVDAMIQDGLWCAFNDYHMGITAENVAAKFNVTREEQDLLAFESQTGQRRLMAVVSKEILPVVIKGKKGDMWCLTLTSIPNATRLDKLADETGVQKDGSVTAGNASGINDGSAALVLMSAEKAALGLKATGQNPRLRLRRR